MELRLKPKYWYDNDMLLELSIPAPPGEKNILELIQNEEIFQSYKEDLTGNIFE